MCPSERGPQLQTMATLRKSKSMTHLSRFSRFTQARESMVNLLKGRRGKRDESDGDAVADNKFGNDYPSLPINLATLVIIAPFVPVFVYALFALFSSVVLFLYALGLLFYFLVLAAFFVTEIAMRPPWYYNTTPERGLASQPEHVPSYWQGVAHDPAYDLGLDFEDVEFKNDITGYVLRGWYVPTKLATEDTQDTCVIFVHGGGRDRRAFLRHQTLFHMEGFSTLLFDLSEHGVSDGARRGICFGFREQWDVVAAARYMKEKRGFARIVVVGTSVGGASVILAATKCQLIDVVVAENPVACANEFALFHLKRMIGKYTPQWSQVLLQPFYGMITMIFLLRIGGFLKERPLDVVAKLEQPLLLMHGTADDLVPMDHSVRLKNLATGPCQLWLVKDAWHCALYDHMPAEFRETMLSFLRRHLRKRAESFSVIEPQLGCVGTPSNENSPRLVGRVHCVASTDGSCCSHSLDKVAIVGKDEGETILTPGPTSEPEEERSEDAVTESETMLTPGRTFDPEEERGD